MSFLNAFPGAALRVDQTGTVCDLSTTAGVGFDSRTPGVGGLGLAGMWERAAMQGGELTVESAQGGGARITVTLPLDTEHND